MEKSKNMPAPTKMLMWLLGGLTHSRAARENSDMKRGVL